MGFSVYVHLPYCRRRCSYCDFNAYAVAELPESSYLTALLRETETAAGDEIWRGRTIDTVFFGGGTPSLFHPSSIARLLESFDRLFGLGGGAEISLEANPGALEGGAEERLRGFRAAGVNRLSLGCQSFDQRHLDTLGRIHSAADTVAAIAGARRAGFDNLSCDLIFAVPGQSEEDWQSDLDRLVDLAPDHVSTYNLSYEEGTPISKRRLGGALDAAGEEIELAMYRRARSTLGAAGFRHYEISNFAQPGRECRHNLAYWTRGDYLGLGAGAHGFAAKTAETPWGLRFANHKDPQLYMSSLEPGAATGADHGAHATEEAAGRQSAVEEYLMLALRLLDGFTEADFERSFGLTLAEAAPSFPWLCNEGLLLRERGRVRLSERGLTLADSVILRLAAG